MSSDSLPLAPSLSAYASAVSAASLLADSLERNPNGVAYATRELLRAVDETEAPGRAPSKLEFTPGRSGAETAGAVASPEEELRLAAADAELARVLLAASEAVGETGSPAPAASLRSEVQAASDRLESLSRTESAARLGFSAQRHQAPSSDLTTAATTFKAEAEATLEKIVDETDAIVTKALKKLGDQQEQLVAAFTHVSGLFDAVSSGANLLKRGLDKLLSALRRFYEFATRLPLDELTGYFDKLRERFGATRPPVEYILDTPGARRELSALQIASPVTIETIDSASAEMRALAERFAALAGHAQAVAAVVGFAATLVAAKFTGPAAPLAIPATYAVIIAGLIVIGRDYMDSGNTFRTVRGVREIARGLGPERAQAGGAS